MVARSDFMSFNLLLQSRRRVAANMSFYNFKKIAVVPTAKDFTDIVLSKTQRKTPTVIHRHYKISRIRSFYMRKVKFTQTNFSEKLALILSEFPKLDDLHPFYADLINVLYDKVITCCMLTDVSFIPHPGISLMVFYHVGFVVCARLPLDPAISLESALFLYQALGKRRAQVLKKN